LHNLLRCKNDHCSSGNSHLILENYVIIMIRRSS
jgi:hypothetical protein